jgi:ribonuclease HI
MARCVWALLLEEIVELVIQTQEQDAKSWLVSVFHSASHADLTRVVVTLWSIWHARRKALHEDIFQSPLTTFSFIQRFIDDLMIVAPMKQKVAAVRPAPRWIPPPTGMSKINVDAALSKNSSMASVAAVARDEGGVFLGASTLVVEGVCDPETMEAAACREGLALAQDLYLRRVRLASDCANVVRAIREGEVHGVYGQIVREIKEAGAALTALEVKHENRQSNVDAHNLARSSIHDSLGRHVWLINPPEGVCKTISLS